MTLKPGQLAPDFLQDSTHGWIQFHEWLGASWGILVVCPTDDELCCIDETVQLARLAQALERRNARMAVLSPHFVELHVRRAEELVRSRGINVIYPVIVDPHGHVARLYGFSDTRKGIHALLIDSRKRVRLSWSVERADRGLTDDILGTVDQAQRDPDFNPTERAAPPPETPHTGAVRREVR